MDPLGLTDPMCKECPNWGTISCPALRDKRCSWISGPVPESKEIGKSWTNFNTDK